MGETHTEKQVELRTDMPGCPGQVKSRSKAVTRPFVKTRRERGLRLGAQLLMEACVFSGA